MLHGLFGSLALIGLVSAPIIDPDLNYLPRHTVDLNNLEFNFNYGGSSSFIDTENVLGSSYVNIYLTYNINVSKTFGSNYQGVIHFNSIKAHIDISTYFNGIYYGNDDYFDIYEWNTPFPRYIGLFNDPNYDPVDILPTVYQEYQGDDIQFNGGVTFRGSTFSLNSGDINSNTGFFNAINILNTNGYPYKTNFKSAIYDFFYNITESGELLSEYGYTHGDNYQDGFGDGYAAGKDDGLYEGGMFASALGAVYIVFARFSDLFNLEVLPNITLGLCFSIPFILILIIAIFRIARG